MKKICVQCQKEFELTESEIVFYKSKGLSIPKRCKECRNANRKTKETSHSVNETKKHSTSADYSNMNKSKNVKPVHLLVSLAFLVIFAICIFFWSDSNSGENVQGYDSSYRYQYNFANENLWVEHFDKHGYEFGYATKEEYLNGAINVINNPNVLTRVQDDGDTCYYVQTTDEFVVVSPEGNIRTYFKPGDGNSKEGYEYFLRQQIEPFYFTFIS